VANSVEDDFLISGEDPTSIQIGDAERWISVYRELLNDSRRLHEQMLSHAGAGMEIRSLERHIHRLEARLAAWRERLPA
jgi:hypothetical protein